ncbi:MAG: ABC transporter permease subunit [Opitutales bacterium]
MKLKYKILKAVDVSGFTFLDPIIRLCYREDPKEQIRRIFKFIIVPVLAFAAFVLLWAYLAPRHTTKSGEVPTPAVVWDAAKGIWTFHERENAKEAAYLAPPDDIERAVARATGRMAELEEERIPAAKAKVAAVADEEAAWRAELVGPVESQFEAKEAAYDAARKERRVHIMQLSKNVETQADKQALLDALRENQVATEREREELNRLETELKSLERRRYAPAYWAERELGALEEERQYLVKFLDILENARARKVSEMKAELEALNAAYLDVEPEQAFGEARKLVRIEDRIERIEDSAFSAAKTFPYQIRRSLLCVFTGFFLASFIAIPIGILCGLSRIFMAAMTPFIAIFKPVSPIVWLPIALIVIGGFIPDPDAFTEGMNKIPLLGPYEINPAFLASAVTVALCSLWPTLVNTALGVASIDKDHINVARVLKLGFWDRLFKIVIPSALPLIFAGLRISLGVGWMVLIAAELLSSSEGIGKFVWDMFSNGSSDSFAQMFVVVFVVGLIGFLLDRIMIVFQRLVSFDGAPTAL